MYCIPLDLHQGRHITPFSCRICTLAHCWYVASPCLHSHGVPACGRARDTETHKLSHWGASLLRQGGASTLYFLPYGGISFILLSFNHVKAISSLLFHSFPFSIAKLPGASLPKTPCIHTDIFSFHFVRSCRILLWAVAPLSKCVHTLFSLRCH